MMRELKEQRDLFAEALSMSVNKNLVDVATLLQWAATAEEPGEKRKHVEQAILLLEDVAAQLADMEDRPAVF